MKKTSFIFIALTALLCFASTSCIIRQYPAGKRTVSVRGSGSIPVEADRAVIVLSVITTAKDAGTAASLNADKMTKVQDAVIASGGSRDAISTENYTIYQEYDYVKDRRVAGDYRVSNQIKIFLKDKKLASSIIDAAIKAGANSLSSLTFSVSNPELAIKQARTAAVQNAQEAAKLIAGTTGSELGKVLKIEEVNEGHPAPFAKAYGNAMFESAATADSETPVQSGKINFTVTVDATFELK
ncbi:MAG: SIMPL domain-containing protein [Treponema sp.]|nr:SIMPL domain-containing protein [Treponema sp.]